MTNTGPTTAGPRLLGPDDGEKLGATGRQDRFMIHSAETDGRFSLVEHILAPRALAGPMHRHTREDEYTFVLEGRVGATLAGREAVAEAGDLLFKPRGEWHTFWNAGETTARMLELISPAGLEDLFRQLDMLTDWPEPAVLADMAARYGCELDFDATGAVIERHDLEL
ncbi:MAG: cupin domain-containing protein [Actinomycetota bacterium]|nr:cupin domain-containing protein [Actinomycetota bacterium]